MTFEELKEEAKKQGYNLTKIQKYIALKKCPKCNGKPQYGYHTTLRMIGYGCYCYEAKLCKTDKEARIAWNDLVDKILEEENVYKQLQR